VNAVTLNVLTWWSRFLLDGLCCYVIQLIRANALEEPAALIFRVGKLLCLEVGGNLFLQNNGPSLPESSIWHHITLISTLNEHLYADVRVHVFPTMLLELKVCYVGSCFVFVHYPVIFEKIFSMKIFLMHAGI